MSEQIDLGHGIVVTCGTLVSPARPETFPAFADSKPMLTMDQTRDLLADKDRTPAVTLFPAAQWIANQGGRGSCNGYAGAKALQRARVKRGLPLVKLSGEGLYAQINGGRDQGSMLDDGMKCMIDSGVPPEDMVPHEEYLWSKISQEAKAACGRFRAHEAYRVDTDEEMACGIALGYVGVIAVHVTNAYNRIDADGVVSATDGPGNHAVCVEDARWRDNEFQYLVPGSWGLQLHDQGRGWHSWRRHLRTTVTYHAFYLIRSVSEDTNNPLPEVQ